MKMKINIRLPLLVLSATVSIAVVAILSSTPALNAQDLSKEGREQKAIHDYLFDTFVEGRETKYVERGKSVA
jgi:hypothetical protein